MLWDLKPLCRTTYLPPSPKTKNGYEGKRLRCTLLGSQPSMLRTSRNRRTMESWGNFSDRWCLAFGSDGFTVLNRFYSMDWFSMFAGLAKSTKVRGGFVTFSTHRRYMFKPVWFRWFRTNLILQSSAQNALELHGRELEPDRPMSVLISDPERKKERTDADANEKEIYVAGLSKFTIKEDLMKLFQTVRPAIDVYRLASFLMCSVVWSCQRCQNGLGAEWTIERLCLRRVRRRGKFFKLSIV